MKISPMKCVMTFGNKGKRSPRYVSTYNILRCIGEVAYVHKLPNYVASVHSVFHVSMIEICVSYSTFIVPLEGLEVK